MWCSWMSLRICGVTVVPSKPIYTARHMSARPNGEEAAEGLAIKSWPSVRSRSSHTGSSAPWLPLPPPPAMLAGKAGQGRAGSAGSQVSVSLASRHGRAMCGFSHVLLLRLRSVELSFDGALTWPCRGGEGRVNVRRIGGRLLAVAMRAAAGRCDALYSEARRPDGHSCRSRCSSTLPSGAAQPRDREDPLAAWPVPAGRSSSSTATALSANVTSSSPSPSPSR